MDRRTDGGRVGPQVPVHHRRARVREARSGFKTPSNRNLCPARTCGDKADRKESFDEPPCIRTD
jgi:hypothetical protein